MNGCSEEAIVHQTIVRLMVAQPKTVFYLMCMADLALTVVNLVQR